MKLTTHQAQRFTKARVQLVLDHPFYGTLATRLENEIDETGQVKTTATDGKRIVWNPTYLAGLTDAEVKGVIAHDVMHCANAHGQRRGGRDNAAWQNSTDKVVNGVLVNSGLTLPKGELMPAAHEVGKSAEAIYAMNPPQQQPPKGGGGGGGGQQGQQPPQPAAGKGKGGQGQPGQQPQTGQGCGEVMDTPAADAAEQEAEWKVATAQAAQAAKAQGKLPGDLARLVDEIVNPRVPWETLLRDFVERTARNDYNWTVPNRRHLQRGIILPTLLSEQLPEIVIAVDTSGSIGKKELDAFAAEVSGVLAAYETTIHVLYVDTRVAHHHTVTRAELPLVLEPKGGGGTDFRPAFQWVADNDVSPACMIYLTDLMGSFPDAEPDYPTLWVTIGNYGTPPWGERVELHLGE